MPLRHAVMRWCLAIARIRRDIVGAQRCRTAKGRLEDFRVARHRKRRKFFARHTGYGVKRVALSLVVDHVVEERTELGLGQLDAGVGYRLNGTGEVEIKRDRRREAVQDLKATRFFSKLGDAVLEA